jgi:phage shock protein PspC (stress-responsive transcriptional regulator)
MKKNFSVNIQGRIFHMDEDAYELLDQYFAYLDESFQSEPDKEVIIEDFRKRISLMLWEETKPDHIVSLQHVEKILARFGYFNEQETKTHHHSGGARPKRLFRDPDNRILGGVCGGIAKYLNIDPLIVRIVFAVMAFVFATGILMYIIMWIIVPIPQSPIDRLFMSGDNISADKVKDLLKKEFKEVEKGFENLKKKGLNKESIGDIEHSLRDFLKASTVFRIISGSFLMALALFFLTGLVITLSAPVYFGNFNGVELTSFNQIGMVFYGSPVFGILLKWSLFFLFFIPFAGILLFAVSILRGSIIKTGVLRWVSQYFGTLNLIVLIFCLVVLYIQFLFLETQDKIYYMPPGSFTELKLELADTDSSALFYGKPALSIVPGSDTLQLIIRKQVYGRTSSHAATNINKLNINAYVRENTIYIDPLWNSGSHLWRAQNVKLILKIPPGKRFSMSADFAENYAPAIILKNSKKQNYRFLMTGEGPESY